MFTAIHDDITFIGQGPVHSVDGNPIATRRGRGPTVVPLKGDVKAALESAYLFALHLGSAWDSNIPGAVRHRLLEHAAELGAVVVRPTNKGKPRRPVRLRHPNMDLDALGTAANSGSAV